MGGIWGTEPNGDTYLRVGLELSPGTGTRLALSIPDFVPRAFLDFLVRPTRTGHGLSRSTERTRTRHRLGLG